MIVDTMILIICLPFYAVVIPAIALHGAIIIRRRIRLGHEVSHWPALDIREDLRVVDVSRVANGQVGVQRRVWNVMRFEGPPPPYPETVEYCTIREFWLGKTWKRGQSGGAAELRIRA